VKRAKKVTPAQVQVLKATPLLEDLSGLELEAVLAFLVPRKVKKGEVIFDEGAAGEEMFIVIYGRIGACVKQADGTQRDMFEVKPGDFFGEMSIIVNESRSATMIAKEDTELLSLHATDFYRVIFEYPMIGVKILKVIRNVQNIWLEQTSSHLGDIMRWGETARRRAVSDELTGLYNRRFLEESASEHFKKGAVALRNVSFLMLDLDRIHEVNTSYGISAGDLVFISTAEILRSSTRAGDICARLAGDEFAVLLPDTELEEAKKIAEKVREAMALRKVTVPKAPNSKEKTEILVGTSIGVASAPVHTDCWEGLLAAADSALRRSKKLGRNRVEIAGY
jgi:diguanylate cyclase (GGDEF)-like protein